MKESCDSDYIRRRCIESNMIYSAAEAANQVHCKSRRAIDISFVVYSHRCQALGWFLTPFCLNILLAVFVCGCTHVTRMYVTT